MNNNGLFALSYNYANLYTKNKPIPKRPAASR